jgi:hypothetical protein
MFDFHNEAGPWRMNEEQLATPSETNVLPARDLRKALAPIANPITCVAGSN